MHSIFNNQGTLRNNFTLAPVVPTPNYSLEHVHWLSVNHQKNIFFPSSCLSLSLNIKIKADTAAKRGILLA